MLILLSALAAAQEQPASNSQADPPPAISGRPAEGFGLGVMVGAPTGISLGFRPAAQPWMVNAGLAWAAYQNRVHVHVDYLYTVYTFSDSSVPRVTFPISVGGGVRVHTWDPDGNDTTLGVRVPVNISVVPKHVPIDCFFEVAPVIRLWPETRLRADAALGARFFF